VPPTDDLVDLHGRVCLVTGAGQGVGRQICLHFAQHGAGGVVVNDFFADRAEQVATELTDLGCPAVAVQGDVASLESVRRMVSSAVERLGPIDVLVNNAGNMGPDPNAVVYTNFWEVPPDSWHNWIGVNFLGVLNCTSAVLGAMVERGNGGRLITIISESARFGDRNMAVYAGAKAGAAGFMRSIAREAARYGITANNVSIGATRTPATAMDEPQEAVVSKAYPLGRIGEPTDIANMALFLASDAAGWITGQTILVNGGFTFSL
jgi:2-hydroxycyclohexanecarboxyl-CoA dehydrogenase